MAIFNSYVKLPEGSREKASFFWRKMQRSKDPAFLKWKQQEEENVHTLRPGFQMNDIESDTRRH
jgi:hypothetical protein